NMGHYWELLGIKRGRNFVYFIDREPAHLFLDKTIWRLEKGTKVTDSKHGFKGCLLFENWRGLSFA
ncbi:hypothetical protein NQ315_005922, partial [Exocentrus adspersus]